MVSVQPQKIWVDEIFLALHYPALATICGGLGVGQPQYMERTKSLTERLNVACKRSQGWGQIGPTAGLRNETNAFKRNTQYQLRPNKGNQRK